MAMPGWARRVDANLCDGERCRASVKAICPDNNASPCCHSLRVCWQITHRSESSACNRYTLRISKEPVMSVAANTRHRKRPDIKVRAVDTVRPDNLAEQAYRSLRSLILKRKIAPGAQVVEGRLAKDLRISRTPTSEALVRLVGAGLLERADARS